MGKIFEEFENIINEMSSENNNENNDKGGFSYKGSLSVCVGDKIYVGSITIAGNNVSIIIN